MGATPNKGVATSVVNEERDKFFLKLGGIEQFSSEAIGLANAAFQYAFGCGMEFAINELNRRTSDGNTKSGGSQD